MSEYKSKYGNVFQPLPKLRVNVLNIDKSKEFCFIYEINKDVGIKDLEGRKKMIFKSTFSPNTNFLNEKWDFIVNHFEKKEDFECPYRLKKVGNNTYLNLIFRNEYFEAIRKKNQKKTIKEIDEDLEIE